MTLPLESLRILAPTQLGAGPFGMVLLGDLGAEVLKVEDPAVRGDEAVWLERLRGQVPCAPVCDVQQALRDEQVFAREMLVNVAHPVFGSLRQVGCPVKFEGVRPRYGRAPALGEHTEEVLRTLGGLSAAEVADLRAAGVV